MREEERKSGKKPFGAITAQALQFFIIESLIGKVFWGCHSKLLAQMSDNAESGRGGGRKTCKGGGITGEAAMQGDVVRFFGFQGSLLGNG